MTMAYPNAHNLDILAGQEVVFTSCEGEIAISCGPHTFKTEDRLFPDMDEVLTVFSTSRMGERDYRDVLHTSMGDLVIDSEDMVSEYNDSLYGNQAWEWDGALPDIPDITITDVEFHHNAIVLLDGETRHTFTHNGVVENPTFAFRGKASIEWHYYPFDNVLDMVVMSNKPNCVNIRVDTLLDLSYRVE